MIIDAHCHLGYSPQFHFPDVSVATMLRMMDRLHIEMAICSHTALLCGELDFGFRESIRAYRDAAGRLLLYTVFDPRIHGGIDFAKRCVEHEGFVGIKIHPSFHQCYADDDRYRAIWELAAGKRIPILTHSWEISSHNPMQKYSFPGRFERFVAMYPEARIILGHAGGRYHGHVAAADLASRYPNVFLDTSGDCYALGLIEYLVQRAGAGKLVYGSDSPWIDPRTQIGMILDANISAEDKNKVFNSNAVNIFALEDYQRSP